MNETCERVQKGRKNKQKYTKDAKGAKLFYTGGAVSLKRGKRMQKGEKKWQKVAKRGQKRCKNWQKVGKNL